MNPEDSRTGQWEVILNNPRFLNEQSDQPVLTYIPSLPAAPHGTGVISGTVIPLKSIRD